MGGQLIHEIDLYVMCKYGSSSLILSIHTTSERLLLKEAVVQHWQGSETLKFGIKEVDKSQTSSVHK